MDPLNPDNATKPGATRRRRYFKWVALATVIIVLVAIALPVAALKYGESQSFGKMTPETRASFDKWYTQKLSIPAEAVALEPFSPEVLSALDKFRQQWEQDKAAIVEINETWPCSVTDAAVDEFVEQNLDKAARFQALLAAFKTLVATPGYSEDLWAKQAGVEQLPLNKWLPFRASVRMLVIDSIANLRGGDTDAAISSAEALIQASRYHPYDSIFNQRVAQAAMNAGIGVFQEIADGSIDSSVKSKVASVLTRHRDILTSTPEGIQPWTIDHIGMTAEARRDGLVPGFDNKTGYEVMLESIQIRQMYCETVQLPDAKDEVEKAAAETESATCRAQADLFNPQHSAWRRVFGEKFDRINAAAATQSPLLLLTGNRLQNKLLLKSTMSYLRH